MKPLPLSKLHYFFLSEPCWFFVGRMGKGSFFWGLATRIKFSSWFGRRVSLLLCSGDPRNTYPTNDEHLSCIVGDFGSPKWRKLWKFSNKQLVKFIDLPLPSAAWDVPNAGKSAKESRWVSEWAGSSALPRGETIPADFPWSCSISPKSSYQRQPPKMWVTRYFLIISWEFDQLWSGLISFDRLGTAQAPRCCLSNCRWPWKASACHWLRRHFQSWPVTLLP